MVRPTLGSRTAEDQIRSVTFDGIQSINFLECWQKVQLHVWHHSYMCDTMWCTEYFFFLNSWFPWMHCFDIQDQVVMNVMPASNYWNGLFTPDLVAWWMRSWLLLRFVILMTDTWRVKRCIIMIIVSTYQRIFTALPSKHEIKIN